MRDYHHAKAMAHTLREALIAKSLTLSQSESLELVACILGFRDWNVLSAKIEAERAPPSKGGEKTAQKDAPHTVFCSFCGKSQHEVVKMIAGPDVSICDACVSLCDDVLDSEDPTFSGITREALLGKTSEELFLLKAKVGRGLSTARKVHEAIKALSQDGSEHQADGNPQVRFYLRKSPDERRAYADEAERRVATLERAMTVVTEALQQRG